LLANYITGESEFPSSVIVGKSPPLCDCHSRRVALSSDRSRLPVQRAQSVPALSRELFGWTPRGLGPRRELVNGPGLTLAFGYANSFFGLRPSRKPAPLRRLPFLGAGRASRVSSVDRTTQHW
jgi:hypothetical protein